MLKASLTRLNHKWFVNTSIILEYPILLSSFQLYKSISKLEYLDESKYKFITCKICAVKNPKVLNTRQYYLQSKKTYASISGATLQHVDWVQLPDAPWHLHILRGIVRVAT